ncbi:hypothetical protein EVAR_27017_1 [Eumeta japonica]|uniref:Uncharacterized protein n=1 Tax=Eumeta variegata TaxID=151549 RepID=A0A4C1WGR1_EUMVA|nr:hypothetical protein EVAR_27017_1 [Eumeta japonica]
MRYAKFLKALPTPKSAGRNGTRMHGFAFDRFFVKLHSKGSLVPDILNGGMYRNKVPRSDRRSRILEDMAVEWFNRNPKRIYYPTRIVTPLSISFSLSPAHA